MRCPFLVRNLLSGYATWGGWPVKILICACTDKAFATGLLPMAHMTMESVRAANDSGLSSPLKLSREQVEKSPAVRRQRREARL
jgi:hypothetical protein